MRRAIGSRVAGFVLTALGALLAGAGSALVWTTAGLRQDAEGLLDVEFRGLDTAEGVATLAVAGAALVGVAVLPRLAGRARVRAAVGLIVAGAALLALPLSVAFRAEDRAIQEMAEVVADAGGLPIAEAMDLVRADRDLAVRVDTSGVWLSIAGGALVLIGAVATLASARALDRSPAPIEP